MKEKRYAIVDIETTGGHSGRDKITEIAIVLHDGTQVIDQYQTLINPERSIPAYISSMTGITDEMVAEAPLFYEVAKEIVLRTEGAIFVAHNARFDYGFLKEEFSRLGYTFSRKQLCTVRLSRQLLPNLKSHSLDSLIRHFNLEIEHRHRALDDALATAEIFRRMTGMDRDHEAAANIVHMGIKEARLPSTISLELLHNLPDAAGVYYFHDENGKVIYVGKSIQIQKRVMQHFAEFTRKADKMQQLVHDITYTLTGSDLIATLLENAEIKKLQPSINRAQRRKSFPYAIFYYYDEYGYLQLKVRKKNRIEVQGTAAVLHELPDPVSARQYLRSITDKFGLCLKKTDVDTGPGPCFYHQVGKCKGACMNLESSEEYNQRVREAVMKTHESLESEILIQDSGRTHDEISLVWISKGKLMGWGYSDKEASHQRFEEWVDHIEPRPGFPEDYRIISHFIRMGKYQRLIKLPV